MNMDLYNETYDFICQQIKKENAKILEIGCGPGNITKYLLTKRPDFKIFGTDIAPNMIELAKKNNPTANFAVMDAREINKLEEKYDAVINGFCLPYFSESESEQFVINASLLLNTGGIIYISFVEGNPASSSFKTNGDGDRVYFQYHELEILQATLIGNNFHQIKIFKVEYSKSVNETDIHTILIAKKKDTTIRHSDDRLKIK